MSEHVFNAQFTAQYFHVYILKRLIAIIL